MLSGASGTTRRPLGDWTGEGPLLERERELASLDAVLDSARRASGRVALIEGVPGVGKSRLLLAARERAVAAGMRVLDAYGSEFEQDVGFGVARQLVGAAGNGGGLAFDDAVAGASCNSPLLVAIDDAHQADEPSLRLLTQLSLGIERRPIALIAAVGTSGPVTAEHLLQRLRNTPFARMLVPAPLSEAAIGELVCAAFGEEAGARLAPACFRATGGNPFYVRELLRVVGSESEEPTAERVVELAPMAVRRAVVVRLARLGGDAAALARAAAILGEGSALSAAAALAELTEERAEDAADVLARGGFLQPGEPLRFVHPLVAVALQADMGEFQRARSHRCAADLLMSRSAPLERVASHLVRTRAAGDRRVVSVLQAAAGQAASTGSVSAAARFLERALQEPPTGEREPRLLVAYTRAQTLTGSPAAGARLEGALHRIGPAECRADALAELAMACLVRSEFTRAAELGARARAELPATDPDQQRLLGIELAATTRCQELSGAAASLLAPVLRGVREGRLPSDARLLAVAIGHLGMSEPPDVVRRLAQAALVNDPLLEDPYGISLERIAQALEWSDELELVERCLDQAIETADDRGSAPASAMATAYRARVRHHRGRLREAVCDGERGLGLYGQLSVTPAWSIAAAANSQIALGELDGPRALIARGLRVAERSERPWLLEARARLQLSEGDPAAALRSAEAAGEISEAGRSSPQPRVWEWRRLAAAAAHRLGDDGRAQMLLAPELEALRMIGPARPLGAALTIAGLAAGGAEGLELLSEAASVLGPSEARLQHAETQLELGAALRRASRRRAAQEALYTGLELADELGAAPLADRARDELHRLGLRPRRAARSGVAALTPSERRVAELAATGLSTPMIAGRLYVSPNTVDTHLRHVYRKLNLAGRGELRAVLPEAA